MFAQALVSSLPLDRPLPYQPAQVPAFKRELLRMLAGLAQK